MRLIVSLIVLAALCLAPATASADCYIKTKIETSGFAGLGGTKGKTEKWISGGKSAELVKVDIKSPLLKMFMDGEESRTVTDLESGTITWIDDKEKTYREMSFADMRAKVEETKENFKEAYANAEKDAERPMPVVEDGAVPEVDIQVFPRNETKKFAGVESKHSVLQMLSTATDAETGDEITYKIIYDAWLAPEFPAQDDMAAYNQAYAEAFGVAMEDMVQTGEASMATTLAMTGLSKESMAPHMEQLQGHPMKFTVRIGIQLTPEQRAELAKELAEQQKESGKGGGFSLGGLKKQVTNAVTDEITDKMVESLFGEGVTVDEAGDPVFFSMTSEVEKIELKPVEGKRFVVGDDYSRTTN